MPRNKTIHYTEWLTGLLGASNRKSKYPFGCSLYQYAKTANLPPTTARGRLKRLVAKGELIEARDFREDSRGHITELVIYFPKKYLKLVNQEDLI